MNERDSEIIEQLLAQQGYIPTDTVESADLVLVNTCSIRDKAEQKVYSLLGHLREAKAGNPSLRIGVTGCVAQQEGGRIMERMPHVDLVVGTQQIYQLPGMVDDLAHGKRRGKAIATNLDAGFVIPAFQKLLHTSSPSPASFAFKRFVTIMQGCNNYCSYCVVPATRGREISRPVADILEEVEILVGQGVREITLLGQNVNSYRSNSEVDGGGNAFAKLLRRIAQVQGLQRVRFTTSHPRDLSEDLMRCFAEIDILCPHFHLPVQSGSNAVLQRMNRKYTVESYLQKVDTLRTFCPDIALATDVIVGFPGETEDDFQATLDLLARVRFHGSFSFKYSDRPHTRSAAFVDKIPEVIKSQRLARFQRSQDVISLERNKEYIGKKMEVMVEECSGDGCKGRTPTNHVVHFANPSHRPLSPGSLINVRINHAGKHSLKGDFC